MFFFISLLFHAIVLAILVVSFNLNSSMAVLQNADKKTGVINAVVISAQPTQPVRPQPINPDPVKPVIPKIVKQQEIKKQAIAIDDKKQKKLREEKIEKQLLADLKKQSSQKKKLKEKEVAAAFAKEMKQLAVKSLQQQMLQAQKNMAGARTQETQGEVNKYKALIVQIISQNWRVPMNVDKSLSAELLIRVAPGGMVLDVQIVKSSGDESLDHSARAAVLKSSPLPVPSDPAAFESFRQFLLKAKPENILAEDSRAG